MISARTTWELSAAKLRLSLLSAILLLAPFATISESVNAQEENEAKQSLQSVKVADVGDQFIWQRQIEWEYNKKFAGRQVDETVAKRLRHRIFIRLLKQHVILDKFQGTDIYANDDEINLQIAQLKEQLAQIDKNIDDYLQENQTTLDDLKFNLRWQLSWQRYIDKTLTDKVLENYYGRTPYRFDGTHLSVSHLLLKVPIDADAEQRKKALDSNRTKLIELKSQLEKGEVTWEAAVAKHSQGTTANEGGAIGSIGIDGPMPSPFTQAAFQLKEAEISGVVETRFGSHLIRCDKIDLGHRNWYDCRKELRKAATVELFGRIAKKHKDKVAVRLTDDAPKK